MEMEGQQDLCLALITARAGSKGLPGKNVIPLGGRPLISYVVQAALGAKSIDRVVVSTDGEEIAKAAKAYGAEVPFMRPAELSADASPHIDAVRHALQTLAAEKPPYHPKWVAVIQPTSPFSTSQDFEGAVQLALTKRCRSVISVCKAAQHPFKMFCSNDGALETLVIANKSFPKNVEYLRRQDLPEAYQENGAIYLSRSEDVLANTGADLPFRKFCRGEVATKVSEQSEDLCYGYVMPSERSIDIDTYADLEMAELYLQQMRTDGPSQELSSKKRRLEAVEDGEVAMRAEIEKLKQEVMQKDSLISQLRAGVAC